MSSSRCLQKRTRRGRSHERSSRNEEEPETCSKTNLVGSAGESHETACRGRDEGSLAHSKEDEEDDEPGSGSRSEHGEDHGGETDGGSDADVEASRTVGQKTGSNAGHKSCSVDDGELRRATKGSATRSELSLKAGKTHRILGQHGTNPSLFRKHDDVKQRDEQANHDSERSTTNEPRCRFLRNLGDER